MNEITYNIIRKMIEYPLEVNYEKSDFTSKRGRLTIKNKFILKIDNFSRVNRLCEFTYNLPHNDLVKILKVVDHCEAMKIRNMFKGD